IQVPGGVSVSSYALSSAEVPRLSPTSSRGTVVSSRTSGGGSSAMPTVSAVSRSSVAPVTASRSAVAVATPVGTSSSLAQGTFAGRTSSVAATSGGGGGGAMMAMGQASRMAAGSKTEVSVGGGVISEPFADTRPGATIRPRVAGGGLEGDTGDPGNQVPLSDSWAWVACAVVYLFVNYCFIQHKSNKLKQQK
ncbi:MAG: hypothetical protein ACI35T_05000, partial [Alistipes sp.]